MEDRRSKIIRSHSPTHRLTHSHFFPTTFDDPRLALGVALVVIVMFAAGLWLGWQMQKTKNERERLMNALENLNAAIGTLQTSTDGAVTEITKPHATDAQVQTGADAILAQAARLDAAVLSQNTTPPSESLRR